MKKYTTSLWHESPELSALRQTALQAPGKGELLLRACHTLVSQGTERLVATAGVPPDLACDAPPSKILHSEGKGLFFYS